MSASYINLLILCLLSASSGFGRDMKNKHSSSGCFARSFSFIANTYPGDSSQIDYLNELAAINKMGLQLALLARGRPLRQEVKLMANKLLEYHKRFDQQLAGFAGSRQLVLTEELLNDDKDGISKLFKLKGALFEKSFLNLTADNQRKLLVLYRKSEERSSDPDLIKLCTASIPELEAHNAAVRLLRTTINRTSKL